MEKESGIRRTVWLPKELDEKVEVLRKELGLGRSGFYRFAIVELLKEMLKNQPQTQQTHG
jgi:metal-responsive CopG/Arc/MetJ family transcriptional regulator